MVAPIGLDEGSSQSQPGYDAPAGAASAGSEPSAPLTVFGQGLDVLAREVGGWPDAAIVHSVMVLNPRIDAPPERKQVELTGSVPLGVDRDGQPVFPKRSADVRAVVSLAQYRTAIAVAGTTDRLNSHGRTK